MSTSEALDMATFERLLDIYGSHIERWPEAARAPLDRLLSSSALARARWKEAERLDALLARLPPVEPAPELLARITSLPARHPQARGIGWWPFPNPLAPLLAWSGAAVLGLVIGVFAPDFGATDDAPADVAVLDEAEIDDDGVDDWSDVSGLAMGADWASEDD